MSAATRELWADLAAADMLALATVYLDGGDNIVPDVTVGFTMPDQARFGTAAVSREYQMEYLHEDLPTLTQGDRADIGGIEYRVRQAPDIPEAGTAAEGLFRVALLTKA